MRKPPATRFRMLKPVIAALVVAAAAYGIYRVAAGPGMLPDGLLQANGRIEGDSISIASKFGGRIETVFVGEGAQVAQEQLLARLDDDQVQAKVAQARQALAAVESQLEAARTALETARKEVPLTIQASAAGVARAEAGQKRAAAAAQQASRDAERFARLAERGAISRQRAEQAELAFVTARTDLESAGTALNETRQQLSLAQLGWERVRSKERELRAMQAHADQARAVVADAESVLDDLAIRAPMAGILTTKIRDVGEVIGPGAPVYEMVDLDSLYLKVYVPEPQIGQLRLDLPAQVFVDAYPDRPFAATARYISSRAEFTPKEVQTPDERVKLVFAVKLYLDANPEHRLMPGMPADAVIRWKEGVPWAPPRR